MRRKNCGPPAPRVACRPPATRMIAAFLLLLLPLFSAPTLAFSTAPLIWRGLAATSRATQLQQPRCRAALRMSLSQPDEGEADQSDTDWGEAMRQLRERTAEPDSGSESESDRSPASPAPLGQQERAAGQAAVPAKVPVRSDSLFPPSQPVAVATIAASTCASGGALDVAAALAADGVVRVNGAITSDLASELLGAVNASLEDALAVTRELPDFDALEWQARFGNVLSPRQRHDMKLSLEAPAVRAALTALLGALQPAIASSLGEDALLYELGAVISFPGAGRQPVHPDTPIAEGKGTDQGATILTAFLALQDVDATMGPTIFLPATHNAEAHAAFFTYENFDLTFDAGDEEEEEEEDAEHDARVAALLESWCPWRGELGAGDLSLYDSRCLHAGGANRSTRQRVLFYCSFVKAERAEACTGTLLESLRGKHALKDWREWLA